MHRHLGIDALGHYGVVMDLSSPRTSLHAAWGTGSEEVVDCLISLSLMGMGVKGVVLIDGCPPLSRATQ